MKLYIKNTNMIGTTMAESEPVHIIKKPDNKKN